uniref:Reverse transcriptase zinc-binding domain-containing protein n=1 Tax=Davidia involucrata TaxID=16924 RepID=A0A5B7AUB3_DAVIN
MDAFFAWTTTWEAILTMENLPRRGFKLVGRCGMCKSERESVNHLLLHCTVARDAWSLLFSLFGCDWVMLAMVKDFLIGWKGGQVRKEARKVWRMEPLCHWWCLWGERNRCLLKGKN